MSAPFNSIKRGLQEAIVSTTRPIITRKFIDTLASRNASELPGPAQSVALCRIVVAAIAADDTLHSPRTAQQADLRSLLKEYGLR